MVGWGKYELNQIWSFSLERERGTYQSQGIVYLVIRSSCFTMSERICSEREDEQEKLLTGGRTAPPFLPLTIAQV